MDCPAFALGSWIAVVQPPEPQEAALSSPSRFWHPLFRQHGSAASAGLSLILSRIMATRPEAARSEEK